MTDTPLPANATASPWSRPITPPPPPPPAPPPSPRGESGNRGFLRRAWHVLVAIKDGLALIALVLFFLALFALLSSRPNAALPVSDGALVVKLDGALSEQPADVDPMMLLQGRAPVREYRVRDVKRAITAAATDDRVKVVVLDLDSFLGGGQVAVREVAAAIDKVRAAKKPVMAFASGYGDDGYLLAAHASDVWLNPQGAVAISGPGGYGLYFADLMEKLGVTANVYRVGTFKSAVEPYIRSDQSPEAKEAARAYATVLWDQWRADVTKARPKARLDPYVTDPASAVAAAENRLSDAAVNAGLVDQLGDRLAFGRAVAKIAGNEDDKRPWTFKGIPLDNYIAANPESTSGSRIAVVPVVGEIVDGEQPNGVAGGDTVSAHILDAVADDSVKAIVLRVDSPGGSVLASEQIRQALLTAKARKLPIVVSMANVAASGGYWVSASSDMILAEPDTITGSIGVFAVMPSFERAAQKYGVNADGVALTPLAGQPNIINGPSDTFNRVAQASVEDVYARFTGLVAAGRKLPLDRVRTMAEGRVWAGGDARQLGLVDRFGGLDDAIAEAARLAKLDPKAVYPHWFETQPSSFARLLSGLTGTGGETPSAYGGATRGGDLFGMAAARQDAQWAAALRSLDLLTGRAGVQAACIECGEFLGPRGGTIGGAGSSTARLIEWAMARGEGAANRR